MTRAELEHVLRVTPPLSRSGPNSRVSWAAYTAAVWALIFAVLHVVWAFGWYVGLDQESAQQAFQRRWFLVYDLVVAALCLLGVAVALALVQPWGQRVPRWLVGTFAWSGTGLLLLRGGAGAIQTTYLAATGRGWSLRSMFWESWFCVGAILFGLSAWRFWRHSRDVGS